MLKQFIQFFVIGSFLFNVVEADEYEIEASDQNSPSCACSELEERAPEAYRHCRHHRRCCCPRDCYWRDQDANWPGKPEDSFRDSLTR